MLNLIWLGLFIILIIIELFTVGLTTIWFAGGSLAALLANILGADIPIQVLVFLAVSCILLIFTRPWAVRHLNKKRVKTNYESEIGKVIKLTERVDNINQTGKSVVNGQEWTVRSKDDGEILEEGTLAKVVAVSGVKLIVEKYKEELTNE
ncbi:MAG TPA: NfeD family protein [Candidatus Mediterraneibacter merdavium]|nr:NfeD family protein [Candidatus Mediterraneibacter merdavium]